MTIKFLGAAVTASFLLAAGSAYAADTPPAPKLSSGVQKQLMAAQTAAKKQDYTAALAAIAAAREASGRTPYDDLEINRYAMSLNVQNKDLAAAGIAGEAAADTDPATIPDSEKAPVYTAGLQLALNAKHYEKAAKYAKLLLATTPPPDATMQALAAQAMYLGGDYAGATALAQKNIDAAKAANTTPARNDLDIIMSSQVKQKDEAGAEGTLELLVRNYGEADDWGQLLGVTLGTKGMRDVDYTYVGRLMLGVGAKVSAADANLLGGVSNKQALYGDAEAFSKLGGPAPDTRETADKKSIPAQITAGAKQGGQYNVKLAEALYGYGMYAEAETAARLAKTKGGATDATEPDMVIGMAQAAQGKYADAQTTFAAITSPTPANARVVRLWGIYAKQKLSPPAAAPAATAAAAPAPAPAK
jgi:hypothetical protein